MSWAVLTQGQPLRDNSLSCTAFQIGAYSSTWFNSVFKVSLSSVWTKVVNCLLCYVRPSEKPTISSQFYSRKDSTLEYQKAHGEKGQNKGVHQTYLHERVLSEAFNTIYMPTTPTFSSPAPSWRPALACMPTTSPRPPFARLIPLVRCVQLWGMSIRELSLHTAHMTTKNNSLFALVFCTCQAVPMERET